MIFIETYQVWKLENCDSLQYCPVSLTHSWSRHAFCCMWFLLMFDCFNVPNYFAYFKTCSFTSLKFLSLGIITNECICSFIRNRQTEKPHQIPGGTGPQLLHETVGVKMCSFRQASGKLCQLSPPFCGIMCPEDWCLCHSPVCWYCFPIRLWAPSRPLIG